MSYDMTRDIFHFIYVYIFYYTSYIIPRRLGFPGLTTKCYNNGLWRLRGRNGRYPGQGETSENKGAIKPPIWTETTVSSSSLGVSSPSSSSPWPTSRRYTAETRITVYSERDALTRRCLVLPFDSSPHTHRCRRRNFPAVTVESAALSFSSRFLSDFLGRRDRDRRDVFPTPVAGA